MELLIVDEQHISLDTASGEDDLTIEGDSFGPVQMLAASLVLCTASVVKTYAETARLDVTGFVVDVRWTYADDPYRVGHYEIVLHLPPGVPVARHRAIIRATNACTVHNTLLHAPHIETTLQTLPVDGIDAHGDEGA